MMPEGGVMLGQLGYRRHAAAQVAMKRPKIVGVPSK